MRSGLILLLGLIPLVAHGWEPYAEDVKQEAFPAESDGIDHLEPFSGELPQSYYLIRYDVRPEGAYQETHLIITRDAKIGKYFLETWDTWIDDPSENRPSTLTLPPDTKMEVPEDLADLALQIWVNELFEVRYDRKPIVGFDGVDYTFSSWIRGNDWLRGTAWSPDKDLPPKWMVQAGDDLLKLARDKNFKVEACRSDLLRLRNKLFAYLKHNGRN